MKKIAVHAHLQAHVAQQTNPVEFVNSLIENHFRQEQLKLGKTEAQIDEFLQKLKSKPVTTAVVAPNENLVIF